VRWTPLFGQVEGEVKVDSGLFSSPLVSINQSSSALWGLWETGLDVFQGSAEIAERFPQTRQDPQRGAGLGIAWTGAVRAEGGVAVDHVVDSWKGISSALGPSVSRKLS